MTASYEARRFGVRSAMPSRTAVGLCPQLILIPARFDAYQSASRTIMDIFRQNAPEVQPMSLDEAFLDVSEMAGSFDDACRLAQAIKRTVVDATALTISLGVAGSRLVAKIASDFQKPDGLTPVRPEESRSFLAPLPVRKLWGVGPKTEAVLNGAGIERIGQLADAEDSWLIEHLGVWAIRWRHLARGQDHSTVASRPSTKQVSREITFDRDTRDRDHLHTTMDAMATSLARALAETGAARTVHIKIRYGDFKTITRQRRTESLKDANDISRHAAELFDHWWDGRPVRLVGVGLSSFVERARDQLSLFDEESVGIRF